MLENVVFYSSLAYNVVLNKLQYRRWFDRIDQSILLGALPFKGKFSKMVSLFMHFYAQSNLLFLPLV